MAFERGGDKLAVRVPQRFKGKEDVHEVVRNSGETEREKLRKPRNKRMRKEGGLPTESKPEGKMQIGRTQQQSVERPHSLSW